jgi:DNA modification methylase
LIVAGDNLPVLESLPEESIHLIYVDPPFATGTPKGRTPDRRYDDRFGGVPAFIAWMRPRLEQFRRLLARTGSLFVHLDYRAVHYMKVELDQVFGPACFVNEIVWCYSVGGKSARSFGRKHDTILWYGKTAGEHAFYPDEVRIARKAGSHMRVVADTAGRPVQVKRDRKTGKIYEYPVHEGKIPEDYWTDIETLNRGDRERTGWPTQKPEALLERIIRATTRPGDRVADFFCGSGTTLAVADRLGRHILGVDLSEEAVAIARARLGVTAPSRPGSHPRPSTSAPRALRRPDRR